MWVIEAKWITKFGFAGIALFPFILVKDANNPVLVNHEKIHIAQQLELLVVGFYIFWLIDLIYCLISNNLDFEMAYYDMFFEKEAYDYQRDLYYLDTRKHYNWINYL